MKSAELNRKSYAVRHIQNQYGDKVISAIKGRFSAPVLPGQTLITKIWEEGEKILFEVWIKESDKKAISGGFIEFSSGDEAAESTGSSGGLSLVTDALFADMKNRIDASHVAKVKGIFKFEIQKDGAGKASCPLKYFSIISDI